MRTFSRTAATATLIVLAGVSHAQPGICVDPLDPGVEPLLQADGRGLPEIGILSPAGGVSGSTPFGVAVRLCTEAFASRTWGAIPVAHGRRTATQTQTTSEPPPLRADGTVRIPDEALRRAVEAALGKAEDEPVRAIEMAGLRDLAVRNAGVADLTGLEYAVSLVRLDARGNAIDDISPLARARDLEVLHLDRNLHDDRHYTRPSIQFDRRDLRYDGVCEVARLDLSALTDLPRLEVLTLSGNAVTGTESLATLYALRVLDLRSTSIRDDDIRPLEHLGLVALDVGSNWIGDLSPIAGLLQLELLLADNAVVNDIWALHDLPGLKTLHLGRNFIRDVSALQWMTGLEWLNLGRNFIEDVSALTGLEGLRWLALAENAIGDISVLSSLTGLEWLDLSHTVPTDLSPLAGLTGLKWLGLAKYAHVTSHRIGDISVLGGLTGLEGLDVAENAIEDISALSGLIGLEELSLASNPLGDESPVAGLTALRALDLSGTGLRDLSVVAGLTGLERLTLRDNAIADVSVLTGLDRLEVLTLENNAIHDLSPLAGLTVLKELNLTNNDINDISALNGLTALERLDLAINGIEDVSALSGLNRLERLMLDFNPIRDISALGGLTALRELYLANTDIDDISALTRLTGLVWLYLRNNDIDDISALGGLTGLAWLWLSNNDIHDISALGGLTGLAELFLHNNDIDDISALRGVTALSALLLHGNAIGDLEPLVANRGLCRGDWVSVSANPLDDESLDDDIPSLRARKVQVDFYEEVVIPDANLRRAVEAALGKPAGAVMTASRLADLTRLEAANEGIGDLSGLEHAVNLVHVDLRDNEIADISPLADNTGLDDGDVVLLQGNPLDGGSRDEHIPALRDRGVTVEFVDDSIKFSDQRVITTAADGASSVQAADLDGDGDADVLSASREDNKIAWYENLGDGAFSGQRVIGTETNTFLNNSRIVHAVDLDGDGDADVLSASSYGDNIAWYENLGGGAFSDQRIVTSAAGGAGSVHAADLDGDGDADVLSASSSSDNRIAWYENLGNGAFSEQRVISAEVDGAHSVRAADLDGDGDADVLSASLNDNKIAWYENLGGAAFSDQHVISTEGDGANSVHAADLDGDGDADLLSTYTWDHKVAWFENLGSGAFSEQRIISTDARAATDVYAADLDGDGDSDVLSASAFNDHKIAWYENLGNGAFSSQRTITTELDLPSSVFAADLDGDGDADVLSASIDDDKIAWYENLSDHGDDHGDEASPSSATLATALPAFLHGTLESAGDRDMFRVAVGNGTLRAYTNGPTDTFGRLRDSEGAELATDDDSATGLNFEIEAELDAGVYYIDVGGFADNRTGAYTLVVEWVTARTTAFSTQRVISTEVAEPRSVNTADLDNDGDVDVLSAGRGAVAWHENIGGGEFSTRRLISTRVDYSLSVRGADLDGDGDADVLSGSLSDRKIAWYENIGGGEFSEQRVISTKAAGSVHAVDLDGDGDVDLLSFSYEGDDRIFWHENLGGTPVRFGGERVISTAVDVPYATYAVDIDGDGDADVVSASERDDKVAWYENLGDGAFSDQRIISTTIGAPRSVLATDLDGDGDSDVIASSHGDGRIAWYENLGAGAFSTERAVAAQATLTSASSMHAADLDGDGDIDVLTALSVGDKVVWYENLGGGAFAPERTVTRAVDYPIPVHTADLDSDGDEDVLSGSYGDHKVAWYENLGSHGVQ